MLRMLTEECDALIINNPEEYDELIINYDDVTLVKGKQKTTCKTEHSCWFEICLAAQKINTLRVVGQRLTEKFCAAFAVVRCEELIIDDSCLPLIESGNVESKRLFSALGSNKNLKVLKVISTNLFWCDGAILDDDEAENVSFFSLIKNIPDVTLADVGLDLINSPYCLWAMAELNKNKSFQRLSFNYCLFGRHINHFAGVLNNPQLKALTINKCVIEKNNFDVKQLEQLNKLQSLFTDQDQEKAKLAKELYYEKLYFASSGLGNLFKALKNRPDIEFKLISSDLNQADQILLAEANIEHRKYIKPSLFGQRPSSLVDVSFKFKSLNPRKTNKPAIAPTAKRHRTSY